MTRPEDFDYDKTRKLSGWLRDIASELEVVGPAINSSADAIALAGQNIGELVKSTNNTAVKAAASNCGYATRWLLGYQAKGTVKHLEEAAQVLRAVVGTIDPG